MWASADGEKRRGILAEFIGIPGALKVAWETTDSKCSKRLHPFLSELVDILQDWVELGVAPEIVKLDVPTQCVHH